MYCFMLSLSYNLTMYVSIEFTSSWSSYSQSLDDLTFSVRSSGEVAFSTSRKDNASAVFNKSHHVTVDGVRRCTIDLVLRMRLRYDVHCTAPKVSRLLINHVKRQHKRLGVIYSFSSLLSLALALVTRIHNCWARSTRTLRFLEETPWAISAQNFLFCIIRTSSS